MAESERIVTMVEPNLKVLKASRKKVHPGDVFVMSPIDDLFLFGRVIDTEAVVGPMVGCILIYVFKTQSQVKDLPAVGELTPDNMLLTPKMINRLPWSRGYFETLANLPLRPGDVLDTHCFRASNGRYYDEKGRELAGPIEPVGRRALSSYRTVDDAVSKALGIPVAPD